MLHHFHEPKPSKGTVLLAMSFHGFVLNWDMECQFHVNKANVKWRLCCMLPFGNFKEASLKWQLPRHT
jgi:hypothetical protein